MSQGEDLEAIDRYFALQAKVPKAQNPTAQGLASSWRTWFDDLGFFAKCCESGTLDEAKKRRDAFNTAMGQPDLVAQGFIPADRVPASQRLDTVAQRTAEFSKTPTVTKASKNVVLNKKLQTLLNTAGAKPPLKVDGIWGGGTDKALKEFQVKHGLTPDGIVGPATWAAFNIKTVSDISPAPAKPTAPAAKPTAAQATMIAPKAGAKTAAKAPAKQVPAGIIKKDPAPLTEATLLGSINNIPPWGKVVGGAVVAGVEP